MTADPQPAKFITTNQGDIIMSKTITIDGVEYAPVTADYADSPVRIVILQRGWVMIGYYHSDTSGAAWLTGARNIRRWGTTTGLGELVNGPLADTVFDPAGRVEFHQGTEVARIAADDDAWKDYLG